MPEEVMSSDARGTGDALQARRAPASVGAAALALNGISAAYLGDPAGATHWGLIE